MEKFKSEWISKNIDGVFALFSDGVEYWETPFNKIGKGAELREMWNQILPLEDMQLDYEIYIKDEKLKRYIIKWNFSHSTRESAGVYFVELNDEGLCTYFFRCSIVRE